jgi:D-xylose transport system substrate-binding protein
MVVALATGEDLDTSDHEVTEMEDAAGESVDAVLLEPTAVTLDNIGDTVLSDGYHTIEDLCTEDYVDTEFCQEAE